MSDEDILAELRLTMRRVELLEELLKEAYPYVESHFLRSRTGFGKNAQILMNRIKEVLGIR